jgi:trimeric autotransporter adhesin
MRARDAAHLVILVSVSAALWGCSGKGGVKATPPSVAGDTFALTNANRLISFNQVSPTFMLGSVQIDGLQDSESLLAIDIRPADGKLYALSTTGRLYTIDPATGAATLKSTLTADSSDASGPFSRLDGTDFGIDFNPVVDRLRVVSDTGQNLRINVDTGATITDGGLNSGGVTRRGVTGAAYTNSFAAACRTTLYFVDSTNDKLLVTNDPNGGAITEVGNLRVDGASINGYEIRTDANGANTALVVLTVSSAQGSVPTLYTINLNSGAVSSFGTVNGLNKGESIRGLAASLPASAPKQAPGNLVAVTEFNKLISFNNAAPQKVCTSAAVTGLSAGESVLGIDLRPADGNLYALGSNARIYKIDARTATATPISTLSADPNDSSSPFMALSGAEFGVDFNPVPDRLRIVTDTGQNLRVNVDTGVTITDATLNPAGSAITAAAYTNSVKGATTTTLHVLDTQNDQLMIQGRPSNDPNKGDLLAVGSLGIDAAAIASFEINGANNTALAAVTLPNATTSELHTVDLKTGAATRVNTIGGGERVRSLTTVKSP